MAAVARSPPPPSLRIDPGELPEMTRPRLILLCGTAIAFGAAAFGIHSRHTAEAAVAKATEEAALPVVASAEAKAGPAEEEIVLPGTVQAEFETPLYARTSGYV